MVDFYSSSDEALVRRAREGNREAFGVLVERHQVQAVLMAQAVLRNMELAKDSSQNAFVKAYLGLGKFREESKFKTWLFRIVINEAKDTLRKEKSRGLFRFVTNHADEDNDGTESILDVFPSPGESPREVLETVERKKKLEEAVYQLPEREREVFILRHFHELSLNEISETLGIAVGTVKAHLSHGAKKMQTILLSSEPKVGLTV